MCVCACVCACVRALLLARCVRTSWLEAAASAWLWLLCRMLSGQSAWLRPCRSPRSCWRKASEHKHKGGAGLLIVQQSCACPFCSRFACVLLVLQRVSLRNEHGRSAGKMEGFACCQADAFLAFLVEIGSGFSCCVLVRVGGHFPASVLSFITDDQKTC